MASSGGAEAEGVGGAASGSGPGSFGTDTGGMGTASGGAGAGSNPALPMRCNPDSPSCVFADGQRQPGNPCNFCDPAASEQMWTPSSQGDPCDDGLWCTGADSCDGQGLCRHENPSGNRCAGLTGECEFNTSTVAEIITLFRGCDGATGEAVDDEDYRGPCKFEDDSFVDCNSCPIDGGPGVDGCYWPPAMGNCDGPGGNYWVDNHPTGSIRFGDAGASPSPGSLSFTMRCVASR